MNRTRPSTTGFHAALGSTLLALVLAGCASPSTSPTLQARTELAPTGKFRVGIYHLNPVLVTKGAQTGDYEGTGIDIYRELAKRLGVPLVAVPFSDLGKMRACVDMGECDAMFMASGSPMEKDYLLSLPYLESENSFLVATGSTMRTVADVDHPGVRVAAYTGSSQHERLKAMLKHAEIRTTTRGSERVDWLRTGQVDAIADAAPVLQALFMPQVSGSRILDGGFSTAAYGLAIPRSRPDGAAFLNRSIEEMKRNGFIAESISRWSLRAQVPSRREQ